MTSEIEDLLPELREICTSFDRALLDQPDGGSPSLEDALWNFYSRLERIAAIIKLRRLEALNQPKDLPTNQISSVGQCGDDLRTRLYQKFLDNRQGDVSQKLTDLTALRGLHLRELNFGTSSVRDFSPVAGMAISSLELSNCGLKELPALLKDVQEARNSLRWYLSEKTRVRTNEARTKRRRRTTTTTTTRRGAAPPSSHTTLSSSSS